jgi:hypothetical protein
MCIDLPICMCLIFTEVSLNLALFQGEPNKEPQHRLKHMPMSLPKVRLTLIPSIKSESSAEGETVS